MKTVGIKSLSLLLILFTVISCSKYEEGSASILTKKSRLVNDWAVVSIHLNGNNITSYNLVTEVIIRDNNTITVYGKPFGVSTTNNGAWVFDSDKSHVLVTNNDNSVTSYRIIRLEKDALKVETIDDDGNVYLHEYKTK